MGFLKLLLVPICVTPILTFRIGSKTPHFRPRKFDGVQNFWDPFHFPMDNNFICSLDHHFYKLWYIKLCRLTRNVNVSLNITYISIFWEHRKCPASLLWLSGLPLLKTFLTLGPGTMYPHISLSRVLVSSENVSFLEIYGFPPSVPELPFWPWAQVPFIP